MSTIKYNYCKKTFLYRERLKMSAVAKPTVILKRERGNAVRALIAQHGFSQQKLRLHTDRLKPPIDLADYGSRVVLLFQALGSVFEEFGRYLSHRPDLSPNQLTAQLRTITISRRNSLGSLNDLLGANAATELRSHLSDLDETPFDIRRFSQRYSGTMIDGQTVEIKVVRRMTAEEEADLELLDHVQSVLQPVMLHPTCLQHAVSDFRQAMVYSLDCRRLADSLETLRYDASEIPSLCIPRVEHKLTATQYLVMESVAGTRLTRDKGKSAPRENARGSVGLSQRICELWLQLASDGSLTPVSMCAENIVACADGTIALVDGEFTVLPSKARETLQAYLSAVACDDAKEAAECLLREFDPISRTVTQDQLLRILRQQVEPNKDKGRQSSYVLEKMFGQWQLVVQHGCLPLRHFSTVIQGLHNLAALIQNDRRGRDTFLEAIKSRRSSHMVKEVAALFDPHRFASDSEKMSEFFVSGPRTLDSALDSMFNTAHHHSPPQLRRPQKHTHWVIALFAIVTLFLSSNGQIVRPLVSQSQMTDTTQILCLCFLVVLIKQL